MARTYPPQLPALSSDQTFPTLKLLFKKNFRDCIIAWNNITEEAEESEKKNQNQE